MQDTATWKASRPLHYLVPFKELDKNSRCSILHTNESNKRFNSEYEIKVAAAMIRYRQLEEALELSAPIIPIRVGGSANKVLKSLTGINDVFYSFTERLKYWDICAGHALFASRFGIVTDKNGQPISYQETKVNSVPNGAMFFRNEGFAKEINFRLTDWMNRTNVEKMPSFASSVMKKKAEMVTTSEPVWSTANKSSIEIY